MVSAALLLMVVSSIAAFVPAPRARESTRCRRCGLISHSPSHLVVENGDLRVLFSLKPFLNSSHQHGAYGVACFFAWNLKHESGLRWTDCGRISFTDFGCWPESQGLPR